MKRSRTRHADKRRLLRARAEQIELQYCLRRLRAGHVRWSAHTLDGIFPDEPRDPISPRRRIAEGY